MRLRRPAAAPLDARAARHLAAGGDARPRSRRSSTRTAKSGVRYHALRTRQAGARRFISFHILVPGRLDRAAGTRPAGADRGADPGGGAPTAWWTPISSRSRIRSLGGHAARAAAPESAAALVRPPSSGSRTSTAPQSAPRPAPASAPASSRGPLPPGCRARRSRARGRGCSTAACPAGAQPRLLIQSPTCGTSAGSHHHLQPLAAPRIGEHHPADRGRRHRTASPPRRRSAGNTKRPSRRRRTRRPAHDVAPR